MHSPLLFLHEKNIGPDQMLHIAASELGLHSLTMSPKWVSSASAKETSLVLQV